MSKYIKYLKYLLGQEYNVNTYELLTVTRKDD